MIVPRHGIDDLGQEASASITFLRYAVSLAHRRDDDAPRSSGSLQLLREELTHISLREASRNLLFPHSVGEWRKSAVQGQRRVPYFISTEGSLRNRVIKLHQDGGSSGRPLSRSAANLPRTVLSVANAAESPTALLARREMQSWRLIHLEPSALRKPDEFTAPTRLGVDGSHMPATLYHLARLAGRSRRIGADVRAPDLYGRVASKLSELLDDVHSVSIDRDDRRELLTLFVRDKTGTTHPARALSDGTLRFLALAVLEMEPESQGVICLEEPENGIHPDRIPAMLRLLRDIATDVNDPIGPDNPLRQVIINTHSPSVVSQVPDDSLLVAELKETIADGHEFQRVCFGPLPETWRQRTSNAGPPVSRGKLMTYLNPIVPDRTRKRRGQHRAVDDGERNGGVRVVDRDDLQMMLPLQAAEA
jgi:predicted ATPase